VNPGKAFDKAGTHRIGDAYEHDRNAAGHFENRGERARAAADYKRPLVAIERESGSVNEIC
jgi:hypothetical protein